MQRQRGFSLVEVLIAMTLSLMIFGAVLTSYHQGYSLKTHVEAKSTIQSNTRLGMDRLARDLRMAGFGVPSGPRVGGSTLWTPAIFHASSTAVAFRADIDGGNAEVTCTPSVSNTKCPNTKFLLDRLDYFAALNCSPPDGSSGDLQLIAVRDHADWHPFVCDTVNTSESSINSSTVLGNGFFSAGKSAVYSMEQVYLRYVSGSAPYYGRLERFVEYRNTPSSTYPPSGATWETVATNLTDLAFEYRDSAEAPLTGSPLSAAGLERIRSIGILLEGFDRSKSTGLSHLIQVRSAVNVRNLKD